MAQEVGQSIKRVRTCIVCGNKATKMGLLRVVRSTQGGISFDPTGKAAGRGAYLCSTDCLKKADQARLQRALKAKITPEEFERVLDEARTFVAQQN